MSGRPQRERKEAERLTYDEQVEDGGKDAPVGSGTPLGELEALKSNFSDSKKFVDGVPALHQLVFKSKGKTGQQRKRLKTFAGIVYGDQPETERQRYLDRALKLNLGVVKEMMDFLGLDRSPKSFDDDNATKEALCERLLEFLECPAASKKKTTGGKKRAADEKTTQKTKSSKASKGEEDALETALLTAVAKHQLELADDATTLGDMIKAAEAYVGVDLPPVFRTILKDLVKEKAGEDEEEEAEKPPSKKAKTTTKEDEEEPEEEAKEEEEAEEEAPEEEAEEEKPAKKKPGRKPGAAKKKPAAKKPAAKPGKKAKKEEEEEAEEEEEEAEAAAEEAEEDDDKAGDEAEKEEGGDAMETEEEKKETE